MSKATFEMMFQQEKRLTQRVVCLQGRQRNKLKIRIYSSERERPNPFGTPSLRRRIEGRNDVLLLKSESWRLACGNEELLRLG